MGTGKRIQVLEMAMQLHISCILVVFWIIPSIDPFLVDYDADCQCMPQGCWDVRSSKPRPIAVLSNQMVVVCDLTTDEGGWLVIQRRTSADVNFFRDWASYRDGFGNLRGNFWWGLEDVHQLTSKDHYELRVDLTYQGKDYFAHYDNFKLHGEADNYRIEVSGYSGNAGDSFLGASDQNATVHNHTMMAFSTYDKDNDNYFNNCASIYRGGWWYNACHISNLNGVWNETTHGKGLNWFTLTAHNHSVTFSEMKIRRYLSSSTF